MLALKFVHLIIERASRYPRVPLIGNSYFAWNANQTRSHIRGVISVKINFLELRGAALNEKASGDPFLIKRGCLFITGDLSSKGEDLKRGDLSLHV